MPTTTFQYSANVDRTISFPNATGTIIVSSSSPSTNDVLKWNGSVWVSGSILQYFAEAQSTAAPNATDYATSFEVVSASTNSDLVLVPKGSGSLLLSVPDNGIPGGNKRGLRAVDLQRVRSANTQVASGDDSVVLGGNNNTASGAYSVVGGVNNTASGNNSCILGGGGNTASDSSTVVCGGNSNTASGLESAVLGGLNNSASGQTAIIGGGVSNTASGIESAIGGGTGNQAAANRSVIPGGAGALTSYRSEMALSSGYFTSVGDAQQSFLTLRALVPVGLGTIDLTIDGAGPALYNLIVLPDNSVYQFTVKVSALNKYANEYAWWNITGGIARGTGVASTSIMGANVVDTGFLGANAAGWTCVAVADAISSGALLIQATAPVAVGPDINFVAAVYLTIVR